MYGKRKYFAILYLQCNHALAKHRISIHGIDIFHQTRRQIIVAILIFKNPQSNSEYKFREAVVDKSSSEDR